nr:gustatory receptor 18 [Podabrus annulatus]
MSYEMRWLKTKQYESNPLNNLSKQSIHHSIKFTLILGQVFGLMPVNGITNSSEKAVKFQWKSWRVVYTAFIILSTLFPIYITFYRIIFREIDVFSITALVFYGNSLAVHALFLVLAQNWENLMKSFYMMEISMRSYSKAPRLNVRLKLMTAVIMGLAFTEHVLVVIRHFQQSAACATEKEDMFQYFFVKISFPQIFKSVTYNVWLGFYLQFIVIIATFSWTYIDLFIMLMSSSIAVRFIQVTDKLASYVDTRVSKTLIKILFNCSKLHF